MIAQASRPQSHATLCPADTAAQSWQAAFLRMLPDIERYARAAFCSLNRSERDEAVQEVIANTLVSYARLDEQGRADVANWHSLARYAIRHYRCGRRTGTPLNSHDVSSEYCRCRRGVRVQRLDSYDVQEDVWREALVEDRTCTPSDLAASRIDFAAFLSTLSTRNRQIAEILASGESTDGVARLFRLSRARVSQLRRELYQAWQQFQGEEACPVLS